MKKALLLGIAITVIAAVFAIVYPSREDYLLDPGWFTAYALCGGVHGDGLLQPLMLNSFLFYTLVGICNTLLYAGPTLVAEKIWKNLRSGELPS